TVSLYEGRIYLETGLRKNVGRQLLANPKVEIAAMLGERWLRITAEAVWDERREALDFVFAEHPELLRLYTPGDGNAAVFYLRNATAQITAFDGTVETICF
ncbi:MAG: NimC/NimA family protein, partial [Oscillospiraceae bacterium]|nr:NimC/NimA family protein [Oscillospiraceae bacterium]